MREVLITGAGRGLGLEFARQYLLRGDRVYAGVRSPTNSPGINELVKLYPNNLYLLTLDVTNQSTIDESYKLVNENTDKLDVLINNAGINSQSKNAGDPESHNTLEKLNQAVILTMFQTNAIGPLMIAQRFLNLLKTAKTSKIINISSSRASIAQKNEGGNYSYCASKAALNMFTRSLAFDVIKWGIITVAIDPGWVQTEMGGDYAKISPAESVNGILQVIEELRVIDAGKFLNWNGQICQW